MGGCANDLNISLKLYRHHVTEGTESISDRFPNGIRYSGVTKRKSRETVKKGPKWTELNAKMKLEALKDEARGTSE